MLTIVLVNKSRDTYLIRSTLDIIIDLVHHKIYDREGWGRLEQASKTTKNTQLFIFYFRKVSLLCVFSSILRCNYNFFVPN